MPISKQAKKRVRSDKSKQQRNRTVLSRLKTLKKSHRQIAKKAEAEKHARELYKQFDQAASKGIIPKGRADRMKSRIAKSVLRLPE